MLFRHALRYDPRQVTRVDALKSRARESEDNAMLHDKFSSSHFIRIPKPFAYNVNNDTPDLPSERGRISKRELNSVVTNQGYARFLGEEALSFRVDFQRAADAKQMQQRATEDAQVLDRFFDKVQVTRKSYAQLRLTLEQEAVKFYLKLKNDKSLGVQNIEQAEEFVDNWDEKVKLKPIRQHFITTPLKVDMTLQDRNQGHETNRMMSWRYSVPKSLNRGKLRMTITDIDLIYLDDDKYQALFVESRVEQALEDVAREIDSQTYDELREEFERPKSLQKVFEEKLQDIYYDPASEVDYVHRVPAGRLFGMSRPMTPPVETRPNLPYLEFRGKGSAYMNAAYCYPSGEVMMQLPPMEPVKWKTAVEGMKYYSFQEGVPMVPDTSGILNLTEKWRVDNFVRNSTYQEDLTTEEKIREDETILREYAASQMNKRWEKWLRKIEDSRSINWEEWEMYDSLQAGRILKQDRVVRSSLRRKGLEEIRATPGEETLELRQGSFVLGSLSSRIHVCMRRSKRERSFMNVRITGNAAGSAGFAMVKATKRMALKNKMKRHQYRNWMSVPMYRNRGLARSYTQKYKGTIIKLFATPLGSGIHAPPLIRMIMDAFGFRDYSVHILGNKNNELTIMKCMFKLLEQLETPEQIARKQGVRYVDKFPKIDRTAYFHPRGYFPGQRKMAQKILASLSNEVLHDPNDPSDISGIFNELQRVNEEILFAQESTMATDRDMNHVLKRLPKKLLEKINRLNFITNLFFLLRTMLQEVKCLSTKELKKIARKEFALEPEKYYPTKVFEKFGMTRHSCVKCSANFWCANKEKKTCGDSQCEGSYTFIGEKRGIAKEKHVSYADVWKNYKENLEASHPGKNPIKAIPRYPVVARWRKDVDFVAAGIFCFQPYCVTGELQPPQNPLICPQFCLRFNDLDNIGITGRHFSGFIMLGLQVFNHQDNFIFFKEECVEYNLNWLINGLKLDPMEITLIEDVWAGGGNLGPCIEYFVGGLEVGNMVFMQYKTFPDGKREELDVKVIDVGIGLERIPWLLNGSATSYLDVFHHSFHYLQKRLHLLLDSEIWDHFGPLSCLLNVDELEDADKMWANIADKCGLKDVQKLKKAIQPISDAYILCDHTRSVLLAIVDGSLPSSKGGGSNVRNLLRRVFAKLHSPDYKTPEHKEGWWGMIGGLDGLLELFETHKKDLEGIFGEFEEYSSFEAIIRKEYERWGSTSEKSVTGLRKRLKQLKKKKKPFALEDWIYSIETLGMPVEKIEEITKISKPNDLFSAWEEMKEKTAKVLPPAVYSTHKYPETNCAYYDDHKKYSFKARVVDILPDKLTDINSKVLSMVILDKSYFYPTSGGQMNDVGTMKILDKDLNIIGYYKVDNVIKSGHCTIHHIDGDFADCKIPFSELVVECTIDKERRNILRNHHTATHIMYAAARKVLGPHVWQAGAKKTVKRAHLDITHYENLTYDQALQIEFEANKIIQGGVTINKSFMKKDAAEKENGFHLYQGGAVPGNVLRVVEIEGIDTEACCGTHCDNTSEVGLVKLIRSTRISDGICRLEYVAGELALELATHDSKILDSCSHVFGVEKELLLSTCERFKNERNAFLRRANKLTEELLNYQLQFACSSGKEGILCFETAVDTVGPLMSSVGKYATKLKDAKACVCFQGPTFLFYFFGRPVTDSEQKQLDEYVVEVGKHIGKGKKPRMKVQKSVTIKVPGQKKKVKLDQINQISIFPLPLGYVQPEF